MNIFTSGKISFAIKFVATSVIALMVLSNTYSQISISPGPGITPEDMVENIVGEGIQYDNVSFQGAPIARGVFSNGGTTNIGIESGIFLTSGSGYVIPGPNTSSSSGQSNGLSGHPSLDGITTATTYDASVLQFDFVPESDTLRFKYVFGSDEYHEWVNSTFNDVFGYFVTGPNPEGGNYSDYNMALIPGTDPPEPVTINTVNNGTGGTGPCNNCEYFVNNSGGLTIEYDGFTTVLTAWLLVVPCETYTIMIGVADAGDWIYDSGVFIEENSFESPKVEVQSDPFPQGVSDNMIECCVEADILFILPDPDYAPVDVELEFLGTATPTAYPDGDFLEDIPTTIEFEPGQDTAIIHVVPVKDGQIEGIEDLVIVITNTLGCIVRYDTVEFSILDYVDMSDTISPGTFICQGQQVELWVQPFNGIPPYTVEWEPPGEEGDTILVTPEETTMYQVNIFDLCQDSIADSVQVTVFPTPEVDIGPDSTVICEGDTLWLNAGSGFPGGVEWQDGSTDTSYAVIEEGLYWVTAYGQGNCPGYDSIYVELIEMSVSLGPDTSICVGDTVEFFAGSGYENYLWQDGSTGSSYTAWETGTYWVQVSAGSCTVTDSVYLYVDDPNVSLDLGENKLVCPDVPVVLQPQQGAVFNEYLWSTGATTHSITVTEPGTYYLEVVSGCGDAMDSITIINYTVPNLNLGPDTILCFGETLELGVDISQFEYFEWQDGSTGDDYTVVDGGVYYVEVTDYNGCENSDTILVSVANEVDLGFDTTQVLCTGESLEIVADDEFDFYTWSNGEFGTNAITVNTGGTYYVDVNYTFGCPSSDTVKVDEYPVPEAQITGEDMLCAGETLILEAPEGPFDYTWNTNEKTTSIEIAEGGEYTVTMKNVCGEDLASKYVEYHELPVVDLGESEILVPGESITLNGGDDYVEYVWSEDPQFNEQYFTVEYDDILAQGTDTISVEVFDGFCKNSDKIIIEVLDIEVPELITPNGDQANDIFTPMQDDGWAAVKNHSIMIFNRWGEKVWESNDFLSGWDGKRNGSYVADGTYYWILEVFYGDENIKKVFKGTLTVLGTNN